MNHIYRFTVFVAFVMGLAALPAAGQDQSETPDRIHSALKDDQDKGLTRFENADNESQTTVTNNLLKKLDKGDWQDKKEAFSLLTFLGKKSPEVVVPQLQKTLQTANREENIAFQLEVIHLLGAMGSAAEKAAPVLARSVSEGSPGIRHAAVQALGEIGSGDAKTLDVLAQATRANDPLLRWFAIRTLLSIGKGANLGSALSESLQSPDPLIRLKALKGIQRLDNAHQPSPDAIVELLKQENLSEKALVRASGVLKEMGPEASRAVPFLMKAAQGTTSNTLQAVDSALARIKEDNNAPQAQDLDTACREGEATKITFPATDKDDVAPGLKVEPMDQPRHGHVKRIDNLTLKYVSDLGFVGQDQFSWRLKDRDTASQIANVTVDIKPDTTPPEILTIIARRSPENLSIVFDEPVEKAITEAPENHFAIKPSVDIQDITLQNKGKQVTLHTNQDIRGDTHRLSITNVRDRSEAANAMAAVQDRPLPYHKSLNLLCHANGNAEDASGNGHKGTLKEGVSYAADGTPPKCFDFSGASGNLKNAVNFGDIDALDAPKSFSIAFWFKRTEDANGSSNHGTSNIMVSQGSDGNNDNLEVGSRGSKVQVYLHTAGNDTTLSHNVGLKNGEWHHFTLTYDAERQAEAHLFLNGERQKKWDNWGGNLVGTGPSPFTTGNTFHVETPFVGRLDELYVLGRPLAPAEITVLAARR